LNVSNLDCSIDGFCLPTILNILMPVLVLVPF